MPSIHQVQLSNTDEPVTPPQPEQRSVEPLPQSPPDSQDLILGKFKSYDELAKAYKELESKLGQPKQQQQQQQSQAKPNAPVQIESQPDDTPQGEVTMEDFARYEEEYAAEGKLSDKTYKELEARGIPRRVVDDYIAGQVARAEQAKQIVYNAVGGEDNAKRILGWAAQNLTPDEIESYNKSLASNDLNVVKLAMQGLANRYQQQYGRQGKLISGQRTDGGLAPFRSFAELQEAQKDPRYKTDPAYRREVADRLRISNL